MDPKRDIIITYKQNGEDLKPDHGYPVRIIIPGSIGGRMVKWRKRITVTAEESKSYCHYNDNRVLPSHVDQKLADAEGICFILLEAACYVIIYTNCSSLYVRALFC